MVTIKVSGNERDFDIDDPDLPDWVTAEAFPSGCYPYGDKLKKSRYEKELGHLHLELVKLQAHRQATGNRILILFEGRDAAGKGGTINAFRSYLNPRHARTVALSKPTDREQTQWYFQRYIEHYPAEGEMVMFDRSWYNRAGVEPVMGFCTEDQHREFLKQVTNVERLIVDDGIKFFKLWLNVGQEMQLKRFHDRRHDPLKSWKLSPIDHKALGLWDDYTAARDLMLEKTHSSHAPWTIVRSNDKRRARLNAIRHVLLSLDYDGKDKAAIGEIDPQIIGSGPGFLNSVGC